MDKSMTKAKLLDTMRTERARWDDLIAMVGEERLTEPGVAGEWSVKDIFAHVTWAERETVGMLQARALVGSVDLWMMPQDQRNEAVFEQNRYRSQSDVRLEAQQVFDQLVAAVQALTEKDLSDPGRFAGWPPDWVPWQVIASNSYRYYQHHISDIQAWLEEKT